MVPLIFLHEQVSIIWHLQRTSPTARPPLFVILFCLVLLITFFYNKNDVYTANFIISCRSSFGVYSPFIRWTLIIKTEWVLYKAE